MLPVINQQNGKGYVIYYINRFYPWIKKLDYKDYQYIKATLSLIMCFRSVVILQIWKREKFWLYSVILKKSDSLLEYSFYIILCKTTTPWAWKREKWDSFWRQLLPCLPPGWPLQMILLVNLKFFTTLFPKLKWCWWYFESVEKGPYDNIE